MFTKFNFGNDQNQKYKKSNKSAQALIVYAEQSIDQSTTTVSTESTI